jgi:hypothetical protein
MYNAYGPTCLAVNYVSASRSCVDGTAGIYPIRTSLHSLRHPDFEIGLSCYDRDSYPRR